jgi:hypothetical protein
MAEQKLPKLTTRVRFPSPAPILMTMAVLTGSASAQATYPFEGEWDCGGGVIAIDAETYFNGADTLTMTAVTEDALGFVLRFADGYEIALSGITGGTMEWQSGATGETFTCARVE